MESNKNQHCYICGFDLFQDQAEQVKFGTTCPCCLFEYGVDDALYGLNGFVTYRKEWIEEGLPFMGKLNPENWTLILATRQLENLEKVNVDDYFQQNVIKDNISWSAETDIQHLTKCWKKARAVNA